jgi:RES domain-containing protein
MPVVWRLAAPAYAEALTGAGNRIFGARWNSPGRGVVYTAINLSLAVLETYFHLAPEQRDAPPEFEAVCINVPDDAGTTHVSIIEFEELIAAPDPERAFRAAGDRWLIAANDLVLRAPSAIVPEESNIMLNPQHPRMRDVAIVSTRPFRFDPRLVSR